MYYNEESEDRQKGQGTLERADFIYFIVQVLFANSSGTNDDCVTKLFTASEEGAEAYRATTQQIKIPHLSGLQSYAI